MKFVKASQNIEVRGFLKFLHTETFFYWNAVHSSGISIVTSMEFAVEVVKNPGFNLPTDDVLISYFICFAFSEV